MKSTFNLLFYLRKNRPCENGMVPIMGRITINGKRVQFSTKTDVHPSQWDVKTGRFIGRTTEIRKKNRILDSLRVKVTDLYHSHLNDYGYVLPEKNKNIVLGIDSDKKKISLSTMNFINSRSAYRLHIRLIYSRYELTKLRVKEFLETEYKSLIFQ